MRWPMAELIVGDCVDVMGGWPAASVDVVVTSPPYNIGIKYGVYRDDGARMDYIAWFETVSAGVKRILKDDGSLFVVVDGSCKDPWVPFELADVLRYDLVLQNHIVWVKSVTVGGTSHGHFKPITSRRFVNNNFEQVFHFTKTGTVDVDRLAVGVPYADKGNIDRWEGSGKDIRCAGNVWYVPYETINSRLGDRGGHPATFPVALAERCILLHGVETGLRVVDPFVGTGTTGVSCKKLGVPFVGIDVDAEYIAFARRRIDGYKTPQARLDMRPR